MRGRKVTFTMLAGTALAAGLVPASGWAATALATPAGVTSGKAAANIVAGHEADNPFAPGTGQLVVDWNKALISILGTPGAQPATIHPTRSFAILQAAEHDAVASVTHVGACAVPKLAHRP